MSDELAAISKQITEEQERINECAEYASNVKDILADIEGRDFKVDQFDDQLVRDCIERVTVVDKHTIRVKILKAESVEIPL